MSSPPSRSPSLRRAVALGTLAAFVAFLLSPSSGGFAVAPAFAADRPSVAVVGAHGVPGQASDLLRGVSKDVVEGFKIAASFEVLSADDLRERFAAARAQLLDTVFLGPAREAFAEGRLHYEAARFEQAVSALQRAESTLGDAAEFVHDQRLLVDVQLTLGLAYASMGAREDAEEAFGEVVRVAPDRVLDSLEYPPKIVSLFDTARAAILARPGARLDVDAPAGTRLFVDGRRIGDGRATATDLPPGFHTLLAEADGQGRFFAELTLKEGERRAVAVELEPAGLGRQGQDPLEGPRSGLTRRLYKEIARVAGTDLVALAGFDPDGNFAVTLYSARSDTFSVDIRASLQASPAARSAFIKQLVERLALYADDSGAIKGERVSTDVLPMHLAANPVLDDLLFGAVERAAAVEPVANVQERPERKKAKPGAVIGVILGILGAGGAATGVYFAVRPAPDASGTLAITIP